MAEKLKNWILPLLFGSSVAYMIIKCYHNTEAFMLTCVFFVYAFLCFTLFELIRKVKYVSGILYIVLFATVFATGFYVLGNAYSQGTLTMTFQNWFYGAQTEDTKIFEYSFALIFMGGFFIISILYYFTQVIYRAFGTMLIMFFPLFIYAKRLDTIDVVNFTVVLAFYLAVLVHNRQMKSDKKAVVVTNKSYFACVGVFVVIVILITSIIPQPDVLAVQEKDNAFFTNLVNTSAPVDFSNRSSLSGGRLSDEILFYVDADCPTYLRRQAFDDYSSLSGWYVNNDDPMANKLPKDNENYVNNTTFISMMETLDKADNLLSEDIFFTYPEVDFQIPKPFYGKIINEDKFMPYYMQLPLYTVKLHNSEYEKMFHGEYKPVENRAGYIRYKQFDFDYLTCDFVPKKFLSQLNYSSYEILDVLNRLKEITTDENELEKIEDLYTDVDYVSQRFNSISDVSDELLNLSYEITAGLETPYEKAKALEGYFEEENFEYDADVFPDDVDDFVFEKKSGACGQFATAMTIMARCAGLNARYVEGFVVDEFDEEKNTYVVREYHSHAYVEVYINGFGWVVFDPTVPGYLNYYTKSGEKTVTDFLKEYAKILVIVILIFAALFLARNLICEGIFRFVILFTAPGKTVILCYNRLVKHLSRLTDTDYFAKTPAEVLSTLEKTPENAENFVNRFEKVCYGYMEISPKEKNLAISEYKKLLRAIRKLKINY